MARYSYYKLSITAARVIRAALEAATMEESRAGEYGWSAREREAAREAMSALSTPFTRAQTLRDVESGGDTAEAVPISPAAISIEFDEGREAAS